MINSQMSIDLNLVNQSQQNLSQSQLPALSAVKKRQPGIATPKSTRSRISTELLICNEQRNGSFSVRKSQIEENKIKFSGMVDLPFVVMNNDFISRGKTFQAFKKVDLVDNEDQMYKMKNIILKRTSPIQEVQTTKKLGDAFYRKKKQRTTGTLYSCELWSRNYYDHILNKTSLKQMHLSMEESAKCKNYDERVTDIHKVFDKWQKQQPFYTIDHRSYLIPINSNESEYAQNDGASQENGNNSNTNFEESWNSNKKSKFFRAIITDADEYQDDSLIEDASSTVQQNTQQSSKCYDSFSQRVSHISSSSGSKMNNKSTNLPYIINIKQPDTDRPSSKLQLSSKFLEEKQLASKNKSQKGFISQRAFKTKKGKIEQNTTYSTYMGDQSTFYNDGNTIQIEDQSIHKSPFNGTSKITNKNLASRKTVKNQCSYLIKNCINYQEESHQIKRQIEGYLKEQSIDQSELKQKNLEKSMRELLFSPLFKSSSALSSSQSYSQFS